MFFLGLVSLRWFLLLISDKEALLPRQAFGEGTAEKLEGLLRFRNGQWYPWKHHYSVREVHDSMRSVRRHVAEGKKRNCCLKFLCLCVNKKIEFIRYFDGYFWWFFSCYISHRKSLIHRLMVRFEPIMYVIYFFKHIDHLCMFVVVQYK